MTLRTTLATRDGKQRYVRRLFATIADRYDFITRFLSYGQDARWKRRLIALAAIRPNDRVLDLACGTGDLLFAAAAGARTGVGLDVTHRMLVLAQQKQTSAASSVASGSSRPAVASGSGPSGVASGFSRKVSFVTGDMISLPFPPSSFTVVTTGYGLRNVPDLDAAIAEIHRVLAPGGRLLSLDFNRPENAMLRGAYLAYLTVVGSALGLALHRDPDTYRYIPESIRNYPGAYGVARMLEQHGFSDVRVIPVLFGLMAIHVARRR